MLNNLRKSMLLLVLAASGTASGCASAGAKEKGAVIGATSGGVLGGVIGRNSGSTAKGAILGAAVGGAIGAVIGHQMDQQAKKIEQQVVGATVERVGEGIQVTFTSGLLFDFDSDKIRADAASNLRKLAQSLIEYPKSDLLIVGHTDSVGDDGYNQTLSEKRARATADYLVSQGVARGRLKTSGRGELEPIANADDEKNRRVEVAIFASETLKTELKKGSN
jgi:outer membrane protein OmpA-like peptidoglycan-associated protein